MSNYTKLSEDIVYSSMWEEDAETCKLWITLIAIKDRNGVVRKNITGISRITGIPIERCRAIVAKFEAPDPTSSTSDNEGRRIKALPEGGWLIINSDKYQELGWTEDKRKFERERKQGWRARQKQPQQAANPATNPPKAAKKAPSDAKILSEGAKNEPEAANETKGSKNETISGKSEACEGEKDAKTLGDETKIEIDVRGSGPIIRTTGKVDPDDRTTPKIQDLAVNPLPASLDTERMQLKWKLWMHTRRGLKKPKSWGLLFNEQLEWLTQFNEETAVEILSASIRNGWTGLFPLKIPLVSSTAPSPGVAASAAQAAPAESVPAAQVTPFNLGKIKEAKEQVAAQLKYQYASEVAGGDYVWSDRDKRLSYVALRKEIKDLTLKLSKMG